METKTTDISNKNIKIPILKANEIVEIRHSKQRIDIYIGITDKTKETQALHKLQTKIKDSKWDSYKIHYDFRVNTQIGARKWDTHPDDCKINVFENLKVKSEIKLISTEFTGYEKMFWFTGIKP